MFRVTMVLIGLGAALAPKQSQALTVVDFHTDAVIQEGDAYDVVNVWDNANVVMLGGVVRNVYTRDTSTLHIAGGEVISGVQSFDASSVQFAGGMGGGMYLSFTDWSVIHLTGGIQAAHVSAFVGSTVNIYGYGFSEEDRGGTVAITGFWGDGTPFTMTLRGPDTYSRVVFHVVPEPGTLGLIACGGGLLLRRRGRR